MKDFEEFRATISMETVSEWDREIRKSIAEKLKEIDSDSELATDIHNSTYKLELHMKFLEAYHNWLNK